MLSFYFLQRYAGILSKHWPWVFLLMSHTFVLPFSSVWPMLYLCPKVECHLSKLSFTTPASKCWCSALIEWAHPSQFVMHNHAIWHFINYECESFIKWTKVQTNIPSVSLTDAKYLQLVTMYYHLNKQILYSLK
jgi:hypothetical protein